MNDMDNDCGKITAESARNKSNTSTLLMNSIYTLINSAASCGGIKVEYRFESISRDLLSKIIKELESNGFTVSVPVNGTNVCMDVNKEPSNSMYNKTLRICW